MQDFPLNMHADGLLSNNEVKTTIWKKPTAFITKDDKILLYPNNVLVNIAFLEKDKYFLLHLEMCTCINACAYTCMHTHTHTHVCMCTHTITPSSYYFTSGKMKMTK